jgi:formate dehydrogenase subunit gamma
MARTCSFARPFMAAVCLCLFAALVVPVHAQQPSAVNPTMSSVKEKELLKELKTIAGRGSIPDTRSYVLEQPAGRDWRRFHEVTMHWIGAIAIVGMLGIIVLFYLVRGMVRIEAGRSGRTVVRFSGFERFVHWMTAFSFVVLALSGLNITFGKELLLRFIGAEAFATWSQWAKYAHNFVSFPFTLGVVLILLMWIAWAYPTSVDVQWVKEGGGLIGHKHPPAQRFNAGQKVIYWVVVLGGGAAAITGYVLMFPFYYITDIAGMQTAQMVHGIVGALFIAVMLAHIYIGTIGMQGAFEAMGRGEVDVNWAQQHHSLWVQQRLAEGAEHGEVAPAE